MTRSEQDSARDDRAATAAAAAATIDAQVALVTGGGGGIGGAIADELLTRGASVLLVDRDATALARAAARLAKYGNRVDTLAADLTSGADLQRIRAGAAAWRGGINVLINNAGVNHFHMFADQPPDGARASFEEGLKGSITAGKLADFVMLERDPHDVYPLAIKVIGIVRTVVGGRTVYAKG